MDSRSITILDGVEKRSFTPYKYQPLQTPSAIRLIKLQSLETASVTVNGHQVPAYKIIDVDLDNKPTYTALSYAWGTAPERVPFFFTGDTYLEVTASLGSALSCLCPESSTPYLWVDQLCIDQSNESERSIQVNMMARIYEQSDETLVWLGEGDQDSSLFRFGSSDFNYRFGYLVESGRPECTFAGRNPSVLSGRS